eukprot:CAMPEP_0194676608 /NCGR_PEP_ID=MMETSP0295-20121207/8988_1 /TAXON_ID=39354 /ORGANISM="Heterosigma akashiwo, Strain CCMP2393" /LENGTH=113 /DNA_ID=CAMNT_0039561233 /DNA_START=43 /DNA_END=385 /DNA_ORIENTATION=-
MARRQQEVKVEKEITIKPGWKDGTKITFAREGDEQPGTEPADIASPSRHIRVGERRVTPQTETVLPDEGMPLPKSPGQRGVLRVKYNIIFPRLDSQQKQEIAAILAQQRPRRK